MQVLQRDFFSLAVLKVPLAELVKDFSTLTALAMRTKETPLVFPSQPYNATPDDAPMVLWSPACDPALTAFMPSVSSGDYFVLANACHRFGHQAASVRSTSMDVEWPINEFIAHDGAKGRRIVRAMKDSPRWEFHADGEPLPFEDHALYGARRVRDRLPRQALLSYLEQWGAPIRSADFWRSKQAALCFDRVAAT